MSAATQSSYKRWPSWAAMALVTVVLLAVGISRAAEPRTADERVSAITARIACPVCNGESVADSRAPSSDQIRTNVERLVTEGQLTDDEIVQRIDDNYEGDLRLEPGGTGFEALAWILPGLAALGGAGALAFVFNRWRANSGSRTPSEEDRTLVEAALHPGGGDES
ncbi:MAG: cytochrome c-type biogenesis protein CcmH [Ilumatobacteraceae bacterium]